MTNSNTFKKQPFYFDQREFNNDLRVFSMDNPTRKKIKDFYLKTTGSELKDFNNITKQLYDYVESNVTDNFMNLPIEKYCQLKGISFEHIRQAEQSIDTWIEPQIENYTWYTNNEKGNEKLADFQTLKKAFSKFSNKYGINPNALNLALTNISYYDGNTNDIYPTQTFINL